MPYVQLRGWVGEMSCKAISQVGVSGILGDPRTVLIPQTTFGICLYVRLVNNLVSYMLLKKSLESF